MPKIETRIHSHKFNQKPTNPTQHKILTRKHADRKILLTPLPEPPSQRQRKQKLIHRSRLYQRIRRSRRHQGIFRHMHTPWQGRIDPVIAIA